MKLRQLVMIGLASFVLLMSGPALGVAQDTETRTPAGHNNAAPNTAVNPLSNQLDTADNLGIPKISLQAGAKDIINTLSFIVVILATAFLIVAGIRYASSNGNAQRIENAKRTLRYGLIGLAIGALAQAIVAFIIGRAPQ